MELYFICSMGCTSHQGLPESREQPVLGAHASMTHLILLRPGTGPVHRALNPAWIQTGGSSPTGQRKAMSTEKFQLSRENKELKVTCQHLFYTGFEYSHWH